MLRYAEQRGITVVPEIDVPGHCYAALQALPELAQTVEKRKAPRSVQGTGLCFVFGDDIFSKQLKQKSENKLDHVKYSGK